MPPRGWRARGTMSRCKRREEDAHNEDTVVTAGSGDGCRSKGGNKLQKKMQPPNNTITKQHYRMKNPICKKLKIPMVVPDRGNSCLQDGGKAHGI